MIFRETDGISGIRLRDFSLRRKKIEKTFFFFLLQVIQAKSIEIVFFTKILLKKHKKIRPLKSTRS